MKVCGIDLSGNDACLVIMNKERDQAPQLVISHTRKICLHDDENADSVKLFLSTLTAFCQENQIEQIVVKKRNKKGKFAGGAVTFKMEGLIQIIPNVVVSLLAANSIAFFEKKHPISFPESLLKYQQDAFKTVYTFLMK